VRTAQGQKRLQVSEVLEVDASTALRDLSHAPRHGRPRLVDPRAPLGQAGLCTIDNSDCTDLLKADWGLQRISIGAPRLRRCRSAN
jgi:hypothetical protein